MTLECNRKIKEKVDETKRLAQLYTNRIEFHHKARSTLDEYSKSVQLGHKNSLSRCRNRLSTLRTRIRDNEQEIESAEAMAKVSNPAAVLRDYASYVSKEDQSIIAWHMANHDFAHALPAEEISVEHWAEDEEYTCKGGHYSVPGGLSQLTEKLAAGLCVSYNQRVERIVCDNEGAFHFQLLSELWSSWKGFDSLLRSSWSKMKMSDKIAW